MTSAPRRLGFRGFHASPRALTLATSIAWRHAAADPVRAIILPQRVLPPPPTTNAGYTIRSHEIVLAQKAAGLDPHVVTRCGFPVTQGTLDGRRLVTLDGIPYHRLLPWKMPSRADKAAGLAVEMAARLTEQL